MRENRTYGLMREGRREPVLYSTQSFDHFPIIAEINFMTTKHEKKICFVISPIGEDDSDTRKRSDQVLKHIITGAVEQLGYEVIRADKISEPGIITHQILQHIVDAPLVIADLTERNPNVFY